MLKDAIISAANGHTVTEVRQKELGRLKEGIARAKGRVVVLVHPFFGAANSAHYDNTVESLLKKSKTPVVILEGATRISNLNERLQRIGAPKHTIIATPDGGPEAYIDEKLTTDTRSEDFIKLLKVAGAKTVLVGGMYAWEDTGKERKAVVRYEKKWLRKAKKQMVRYRQPLTGGCAGTVYSALVESKLFKNVRWMPKTIDIGQAAPYASPYSWHAVEKKKMFSRFRKLAKMLRR